MAEALLTGRALALDNRVIAFQRWATAMAAGDFELGWRLNDVADSHWPSAHHLWKHRSLTKSAVEIVSLHGLGDAVQMLPLASHLRAAGCSVQFTLPAALRPLTPFFEGVSSAPSRAEAQPGPPPQAEIMELPYLLRLQLEDLPLGRSYLRLPRRLLRATAYRMGPRVKPRVGIVWSGGTWDPDRWIPVPLLESFIEEDAFEWWNVQGGDAARQMSRTFPCHVRRVCGDGLVRLAAVIANLDVLVTIDTLAAHLAGAMGVPALVLLKHNADWRWLRDRSDSPWYPSLRLFRQSEPGNWETPIRAAVETLQQDFAAVSYAESLPFTYPTIDQPCWRRNSD